ncbi:MAG: Hsp20/alpha crystallin family protein [Oscillospiraceae bacterium]|nr:Hsp20/alpha crystallin family protein [Oscillospiraceae bacterium]
MLLKPYYRTNNSIFDPFRELDMLEQAFFGSRNEKQPERLIRTDIREEGGAYILEAELPGFKKDDLSIELNDNMLTISAEQNFEHEEKNENGGYIMRERRRGSFRRSYDVTGIDTESLKASFENGVLTLTMPKLPELKPKAKSIAIE